MPSLPSKRDPNAHCRARDKYEEEHASGQQSRMRPAKARAVSKHHGLPEDALQIITRREADLADLADRAVGPVLGGCCSIHAAARIGTIHDLLGSPPRESAQPTATAAGQRQDTQRIHPPRVTDHHSSLFNWLKWASWDPGASLADGPYRERWICTGFINCHWNRSIFKNVFELAIVVSVILGTYSEEPKLALAIGLMKTERKRKETNWAERLHGVLPALARAGMLVSLSLSLSLSPSHDAPKKGKPWVHTPRRTQKGTPRHLQEASRHLQETLRRFQEASETHRRTNPPGRPRDPKIIVFFMFFYKIS